MLALGVVCPDHRWLAGVLGVGGLLGGFFENGVVLRVVGGMTADFVVVGWSLGVWRQSLVGSLRRGRLRVVALRVVALRVVALRVVALRVVALGVVALGVVALKMIVLLVVTLVVDIGSDELVRGAKNRGLLGEDDGGVTGVIERFLAKVAVLPVFDEGVIHSASLFLFIDLFANVFEDSKELIAASFGEPQLDGGGGREEVEEGLERKAEVVRAEDRLLEVRSAHVRDRNVDRFEAVPLEVLVHEKQPGRRQVDHSLRGEFGHSLADQLDLYAPPFDQEVLVLESERSALGSQRGVESHL